MKKEIKTGITTLVVGLMILSAGSYTWLVRDFPSLKPNNNSIADIYPATKTATYMGLTGGGIFQYGDCNNAPIGSRVLGWTVIAPLSLLAIPGAVLCDTILLPVDLRHHRSRPKIVQMTIGQKTDKVPSLLLLDTSDQHFDGSPQSTLPWATFKCLPSGDSITVKPGHTFSSPGDTNTYTLESVYYQTAWVKEVKQESSVQPPPSPYAKPGAAE